MNSSLHQLRQSAAILLANAVCDVFPGVRLVEGRVSEFGFSYDFVAEQPIDAYAIPLIEEKMRALSKADIEIRSLAMMRENAAQLFSHHGQSIKAEIVGESLENIVSVCQIGEFFDFCPALTIASTSEIRVFKILKIEKVQLHRADWEAFDVVRIRGTAFADLKSLKRYVKAVEAAKKRDHRVLAKELELCGQHADSGSVEWHWLPRGAALRDTLRQWWYDEHRRQGYMAIKTPSFVKEKFLIRVGLQADAAAPVCSFGGADYVMPISRSPLHALEFCTALHSYRELPVRYVECAQVYDPEKDGKLWGLFNAQLPEADAAHVFCSAEQVEKEMISSLQFIGKITKILGFEHHWSLGGRGAKYAGTLRQWESALQCFDNAFKACELSYAADSQAEAFAGPVAQAYIVDALGREWKGPSLAVDFNCPERLGLRYQNQNDDRAVPFMLVRTLFGSLERFIALLVEHFAGAFPLWLAPEQVRVITVGQHGHAYAHHVWQTLNDRGYRVGADYSAEQLGKKIHQAESKKVPYLVIIGDKEEKQNLLTVRSGYCEKIQADIALEDFARQIEAEVKAMALPVNSGSTKYGR